MLFEVPNFQSQFRVSPEKSHPHRAPVLSELDPNPKTIGFKRAPNHLVDFHKRNISLSKPIFSMVLEYESQHLPHIHDPVL
jgi:hypothetical protein